MTNSGHDGLFAGLFDRSAVDTGDQAWLQALLDTEAALARALERAGLAPEGAGAAVTAAADAAQFDVADLGRQAAATATLVPALVRALSARVPQHARDAVHRGASSQDIMDTAVMLIAARALDAIIADLSAAAGHAAGLAAAHKDTVMVGRTLLQQAVPVTFGLVAAGWLTGIDDARDELARVRAAGLAVQFGGAAGTLAALGDSGSAVAGLLAEEVGLPEPVLPWHTDRQRILRLAAALTAASAAVGKVARDVTLLAQTEIGEVAEGAGEPGRGGSSAMPQKRNPVASVLLLACARRAPGLLATLAAAGEQELQRAAGAWQAEWETLSDLLRLTGSAASWSAELLAGLTVEAGRMRANLDAAGGLPLAEHLSAVLTPALGRLPAHDLVSAAAARAVRDGTSLPVALLADEGARTALAGAGIGRAELDAAVDPAAYLGTSAVFIHRALAAHHSRVAERSAASE